MQKSFSFLLLLGLVTVLKAQSKKNSNQANIGEFKIKIKGFDDLIQPNSIKVSSTKEDIDDINISPSEDINTVLKNEKLIRLASKRDLRNWLKYQRNNKIKPAIENILNQKFNNYKNARQALYKITEEFNLNHLLKHSEQEYDLNIIRKDKIINQCLRNLKLLSIREKEIRNGNLNNSLYPKVKINEILLKNIKNIGSIKNLRKDLIKLFESNSAEKHLSEKFQKKLLELNTKDLKNIINIVINKERNYYDCLDEWMKITYTQALLFKLYVIKSYLPKRSYTYPNFKYTMLTSSHIEQYIKDNTDDIASIFDDDYYNKLINKDSRKTNQTKKNKKLEEEIAKKRWEIIKEKELNHKLNKTSIGCCSKIDFLIETFNIKNPNVIQWLNENHQKETFNDLLIKIYSSLSKEHDISITYNKYIKEQFEKSNSSKQILNKNR